MFSSSGAEIQEIRLNPFLSDFFFVGGGVCETRLKM